MKLQEDNYVEKAEKVILELQKRGNMITTSQIRNILAMAADIYNEVRISNSTTLRKEICGRIQYLKVHLVYAAGRKNNENVKEFVKVAELLACIDEIQDSRERYLLFNRYMEALVAYHKYHGGKD